MNYFYISVNADGIGEAMHKWKTGLDVPLPPIKLNASASKGEKLLKMLALEMTAYDSKQRPSVDTVLTELERIHGEDIILKSQRCSMGSK